MRQGWVRRSSGPSDVRVGCGRDAGLGAGRLARPEPGPSASGQGLPVGGALEARFYYLHAAHLQAGGGWVGNRSFCTARQSFKIAGRDKCEERGYAKAGFFEVDTKDATDYTHRLTE